MDFRYFILICVFLGGVAFLPSNVFAEKNSAAGQQGFLNSEVQSPVSEKIENPVASEKAVPDTPEDVHKSQNRLVQKTATNPSTQQNLPLKPVPKSPNKTNKGIEKIVPSLQKNIKAGESAEPSGEEKDTGQMGPTANVKDTGPGPEQPNSVKKKLLEVTKSVSLNQADSEVEINRHPAGFNAKSEFFKEDTDPSVSMKTSSSLALAQKPHVDEENKTPSSNREIPGVIEIMINPPQRAQSSGVQSDDQFSPGAGTINFIANSSDGDEFIFMNGGKDYISRQAKYCDQWINGPPSPPPKVAPFFLTFSVNLSHS